MKDVSEKITCAPRAASKFLFAVAGMLIGVVFFVACAALPAFGPVFACISSELAQGALEDPLLLISGCLGATIEALITVITQELDSSPADASADVAAAADASAGPGSSDAAVLADAAQVSLKASLSQGGWNSRDDYESHLKRILAKAQALKAQGVK